MCAVLGPLVEIACVSPAAVVCVDPRGRTARPRRIQAPTVPAFSPRVVTFAVTPECNHGAKEFSSATDADSVAVSLSALPRNCCEHPRSIVFRKVSTMNQAAQQMGTDGVAIVRFTQRSGAELTELRRRIKAQSFRQGDGPDASKAYSCNRPGDRGLLGLELRLAKGRSETERPAAVLTEIDGLDIHHSCPLETRERAALIGPMDGPLDHRADEDHRSPDQSHRAWRSASDASTWHRRSPDTVTQASRQPPAGMPSNRTCLGCPDEAPGIRKVRGTRGDWEPHH